MICWNVSRRAWCIGMVIGLFSLLSLTAKAQTGVEMPSTDILAAAVEKVGRSVVQIETIGGVDQVAGNRVSRHPRTGTVVGSQGYIVTATFNLAHNPTTIFVQLPDGRRFPAEIIAQNHSRKITLLQVTPDIELQAVQFVDRSQLSVGQTVIAVGRSFDLKQTNISTGIVSAVERIWGKAIQTDAAVSPHNFGGPLIDIEGNVTGILVPLSPDGSGVADGTEWYDSGIGFAVPLDELRLAEMVQGNDLFPGILGVTFKEDRGYSSPPVVSACPGNSPAGIAGLKPGDRIVQIDDVVVQRVHQVRHALGPRYAFEKVSIQFERDGEERTTEAELADKIRPWQHAMTGIVVASDDGHLVIRQVIPGGPAELAGLKAGDRILEVADTSTDPTVTALETALMTREVGSPFDLMVDRNGEHLNVTLKLDALSAVPLDVPRSVPAEASEPFEVKVAEHANRCHAYFPKSDRPSGLLMWIGEPGKRNLENEMAAWKSWCDQTNTALLLPQSQEEKQWSPAEIEYLNKVAAQAMPMASIDPWRVAVGGPSTGGVMASLVAMSERETWKGLILLNTGASGRVASIQSEPASRVMILMLDNAADKKTRQTMTDSSDVLGRQGFAVHVLQIDNDVKEVIATWVSTLNRF